MFEEQIPFQILECRGPPWSGDALNTGGWGPVELSEDRGESLPGREQGCVVGQLWLEKNRWERRERVLESCLPWGPQVLFSEQEESSGEVSVTTSLTSFRGSQERKLLVWRGGTSSRVLYAICSTFLKFKAASETKSCSLKPQNHKTDHLGCVFSPRNAQRSGPAWREMLGFAGQRGGGWTCRWWTMDSPPGCGDSEEIPHMRLGDVVRDLWTGWRVKIKKMGGWQTRSCLYLTRREKCGAAQ